MGQTQNSVFLGWKMGQNLEEEITPSINRLKDVGYLTDYTQKPNLRKSLTISGALIEIQNLYQKK